MVGIIRKSSPASDLLIVGRRADGPKSPLTVGISDWSEHLELGVLGDLLTSTDFECHVSTLVVQQQTRAAVAEISRSPQNNTETPTCMQMHACVRRPPGPESATSVKKLKQRDMS